MFLQDLPALPGPIFWSPGGGGGGGGGGGEGGGGGGGGSEGGHRGTEER